ncbi:hypothetical protein DL95DRAFT_388837, partial [Leptodontidium sp. 2 PMI_412]
MTCATCVMLGRLAFDFRPSRHQIMPRGGANPCSQADIEVKAHANPRQTTPPHLLSELALLFLLSPTPQRMPWTPKAGAFHQDM